MEAWPVWVVAVVAILLVWVAFLAGRRQGRALLEDRALRRALSTKVRDVMTRPVVFVRQGTPAEEAARIMYERNVGCLPVLDAQGRMAGIATESDLTGIRAPLRRLSSGILDERVRIEGAEEAYAEIRSRPIEEVMTRQVIAASEDEPISDVVIRMIDHDLHHIPVIKDDVPLGVVSRHDLLALFARRSR